MGARVFAASNRTSTQAFLRRNLLLKVTKTAIEEKFRSRKQQRDAKKIRTQVDKQPAVLFGQKRLLQKKGSSAQ